MSTVLEGYPVRVDIPVAWGEMDAYGHVNNIVYFRYFETARMAYFDRLQDPGFLARDPLGPILAATRCRFRAPLKHPDRVTVGARVSSVEEDRFVMAYAIFSHAMGRIAAEGDGTIVCYDYRNSRKAPLPEHLKLRIAQIENGR
jgi:acyl-CoA thioester hydrolase